METLGKSETIKENLLFFKITVDLEEEYTPGKTKRATSVFMKQPLN